MDIDEGKLYKSIESKDMSSLNKIISDIMNLIDEQDEDTKKLIEKEFGKSNLDILNDSLTK